MLKIKIENEETRNILQAMHRICTSKKAKEREKDDKYLLTVIKYDSELRNLVATNSFVMLAYNIAKDEELLNKLGDNSTYLVSDSEGSTLIEATGIPCKVFPPYVDVMRKNKFAKYVELDELRKQFGVSENRNARNFDLMLESAVYCARSLFHSASFEYLNKLEFDTLWFADDAETKCRPIRLKSSKLRLLALVMPLRKEKVGIKTKT